MIITGRENQYCKGVNFLQIDLKLLCNSIKIQTELVVRLGKLILKSCMEQRRSRITKTFLKNKKVRGPALPKYQKFI